MLISLFGETTKKIVFFGTGAMTADLIHNTSFKVSYFVDNNQNKWETIFEGKQVKSPEVLLQEDKNNIIIVIASMYYSDIANQLIGMGFSKYQHFYNGKDFVETYFYQASYAQEGEDLILSRIFEKKRTGFYVDIGAHHPLRFSNTYAFYKKGWVGINIDPNPDSIELFHVIRPNDVNLNVGIADRQKSLTYYMFDEPALNSFDKGLSNSRNSSTPYKLIEERNVQCTTLENVFNEYLNGKQVDFLNIDVEGFELEVLESNNWMKYSPEYITIEILGTELNDVSKSSVHQFLERWNYKLFAKTFNTFFYKIQKSENS